MLPDATSQNCPYERLCYAVAGGEFRLCLRAADGSDLPDLIGSQLGQSATLSSGKHAASLGNHVVDVDLLSSEKEMVRSHARRVVAAVENGMTLRNGAMVELPCDALRMRHARCGFDISVALKITRACPNPTPSAEPDVDGTVLVDLLPESLGKAAPTTPPSVSRKILSAIAPSSIDRGERSAAATRTFGHFHMGRSYTGRAVKPVELFGWRAK